MKNPNSFTRYLSSQTGVVWLQAGIPFSDHLLCSLLFLLFSFFFSFLQNLSILLKEKIIPNRPSFSPYFMRLPLISLMFLFTPFEKNFSILSRNLSTSHSRWPLSTSPPNSLIFPKIPSQSSSPTVSFYFPTKNSFLFLPK